MKTFLTILIFINLSALLANPNLKLPDRKKNVEQRTQVILSIDEVLPSKELEPEIKKIKDQRKEIDYSFQIDDKSRKINSITAAELQIRVVEKEYASYLGKAAKELILHYSSATVEIPKTDNKANSGSKVEELLSEKPESKPETKPDTQVTETKKNEPEKSKDIKSTTNSTDFVPDKDILDAQNKERAARYFQMAKREYNNAERIQASRNYISAIQLYKSSIRYSLAAIKTNHTKVPDRFVEIEKSWFSKK